MLKFIVLLSIVVAQVVGSVAFAEGLRFYEWNPGNTIAPMIIAARDSETPEQAAERYLRELSCSPLMEIGRAHV